MTKQIDDGGPAFPGQMPTGYDPRSGDFVEGMSLRAYFAGQAMVGAMASEIGGEGLMPQSKAGEDYKVTCSREFVAYADALITELAKKDGE